MKLIILALLSFSFGSCVENLETEFELGSQEELSTKQDKVLKDDDEVKEPSFMCATIYDPVCAKVVDPKCAPSEKCIAEVKTYSSDCFAALENADVLYPGECQIIKEEPVVKLPEFKVCPMVYAPVCGEVDEKTGEEKTFGNMCELENSGAEFLRYGACDQSSLEL